MAASDCADGSAAAPPELRLYWLCERFHCPPDAILRQDAALLERMIIAANTYEALDAYRRAGANDIGVVEFSERSPDTWHRIVDIERLRNG